MTERSITIDVFAPTLDLAVEMASKKADEHANGRECLMTNIATNPEPDENGFTHWHAIADFTIKDS